MLSSLAATRAPHGVGTGVVCKTYRESGDLSHSVGAKCPSASSPKPGTSKSRSCTQAAQGMASLELVSMRHTRGRSLMPFVRTNTCCLASKPSPSSTLPLQTGPLRSSTLHCSHARLSNRTQTSSITPAPRHSADLSSALSRPQPSPATRSSILSPSQPRSFTSSHELRMHGVPRGDAGTVLGVSSKSMGSRRTPGRSIHRTGHVTAASTSSSSFSKPALSVSDTDKLPPRVRDAVLKAVERLGGRVTVGDTAAAAGISLTEADRALKALAADANGFLEVSDEGDVLYVFPREFRAVLVQNSLRLRLAPFLKKAKDVGSYVLRVSFGTALIVSIVVVYTAIAALLSSRSDNDRGERGGGGYRGGGGMYYSRGPAFYIDFTDLFWYWDPFYYSRLRSRLVKREMSFVESVFSFVFGDGDPNEGLDEACWQAVGELISSKGGVVAAQEVAPFLDLPKDFQESETYMLPVVQRFDGYPEVDPQGNILYRFPQLQRTAKDWAGRPKVLTGQAAMDPGYTFPSWGQKEEQQQQQGYSGPGSSLLYFARNLWEFSGAPKYKQVLAAGLGAVNLVGVLWLSYLISDPATVRQAGSELVASISSFLPLLQVYACSFFAIPALRWATQQRQNESILEENQRREESALLLSRPPAPLKRKLTNARAQAEKVVLDQDRVIYSTAKDLQDQTLEQSEWDRKLEKSEKQVGERGWDNEVERQGNFVEGRRVEEKR